MSVTLRQRKAVDLIVENGGNVSRAMIGAGYSKQTAKTPQKLTESQGFKELCNERGLTDNFLIGALVHDIKNKKLDRSKELALAFKITGRMIDKSETHSFQHINISDNDFIEIIREYKQSK